MTKHQTFTISVTGLPVPPSDDQFVRFAPQDRDEAVRLRELLLGALDRQEVCSVEYVPVGPAPYFEVVFLGGMPRCFDRFAQAR